MLIRQFFRPDAEIRDAFFFKEISSYADSSCLLALGHTHILTTLSLKLPQKNASSEFAQQTGPSFKNPFAYDRLKNDLYSNISCSLETFGDQENFKKGYFQIGMEKVLHFLNQKTPLRNLHFEAKCYILNDDGNSFSAAVMSLQHVFSEAIRKYLNQPVEDNLPPVFAMSAGLFGQQIFIDLDAQEEKKADALAYFIFTHKGDLLFSSAYAQFNAFSTINFVHLADLSFHQSKQMKILPLKISKELAK